MLTIGFFLRIKDVGTPSLWFDESISSIAALAILEKGMPIFDSGFFYGRAILNTFFIATSFKIFGVNEFAGRLPSVFFGTLTIYLVYVIGSKWGNKRVGILAALLLAFSVWEIAWSRQARMYQQLQFFYILSLYLYYEFWTTKNIRILILLVISSVATMLTHIFGYSLVVIFLICSITFYFIENRKVRLSLKKVFPLAIAGILLLGFVYYKGIISSVTGIEVNYYNKYIHLLKKDL
ncbi:MAG: glycosyltransferase family 39 protein, partial [Methanosarcinaceae archaeon]|nr:glycosyltransferase family 39 protein [Methanosarcinaceae archaeon]